MIYGQPVTLGSKSDPALLWENANPGGTFSAQTLVLGVEWAAYLIEIQYNAPRPSRRVFYVPAGVMSTDNYKLYLDGVGAYRIITSTASDSVAIGKGYDDKYEDNALCVPSRIWGMKVTL